VPPDDILIDYGSNLLTSAQTFEAEFGSIGGFAEDLHPSMKLQNSWAPPFSVGTVMFGELHEYLSDTILIP